MAGMFRPISRFRRRAVVVLLALPLLAKGVGIVGQFSGDDLFDKGSSPYPNFESWVQINSLSTGASVNISFSIGGGTGASRASLSGVSFTKRTDATSLALLSRLTTGQPIIETATIHFLDTIGTQTIPVLTLKMEDVLVSSWSIAGSEGGDHIYESWSLTPSALRTTVAFVNADDGRISQDTAFWNFRANSDEPLYDPNTPPSLSNSFQDQVMDANTTRAINFTVGDAETPAGALLISLSSTNPLLLPPSQIAVGGSGVSRSLTLQPLADAHGSATITVQVSDGEALASQSFVVTVNEPPPDPLPSIQITAASVAENSPSGTFIGELSLIGTEPPGPIAFSLLNDAGGRFAIGGESSSSLLVGPNAALDYELATSHAITVVVSDGLDFNFSQQVLIQVLNLDDDPPATGEFDFWKMEFFNAEQLLDPDLSGPNADFDKDGIPNLVEYALGLRPNDPSGQDAVELIQVEVDGITYPAVRFSHIGPARDPSIEVVLEVATNSFNWSSGPGFTDVVSSVPVDSPFEGFQQVVIRSTTPFDPQSPASQILRVRFSLP